MPLEAKHFYGVLSIKADALPPRVGGTAALSTTIGQECLDEYCATYEQAFIDKFFGKEIANKIASSDVDVVKVVYGSGDKPRSCLANFVYHEMLTNTAARTTERGGQMKDSAYIHTLRRAKNAWNLGVAIYQDTLDALYALGYLLTDVKDKPIKLKYPYD